MPSFHQLNHHRQRLCSQTPVADQRQLAESPRPHYRPVQSPLPHFGRLRSFLRPLHAMSNIVHDVTPISKAFLKPKATPGILQAQRHFLNKLLPVKSFEESVKENDPKALVVEQKSSQSIDFVPSTPFVDPFLRILKRKKHVMKMNQHAWRERRQNFEKYIIHVAIDL